MKDWIPLDLAKLREPFGQEIAGVQVNVLISPYDVPVAIRGTHTDHRVLIEFRYLDEEPSRREDGGQGVTLLIGRHSGRVMGIELPLEVLGAEGHVEINLHVIEQALESALPHSVSRRGAAQRNFKAATQAITEAADRLLSR